MTAYDNHNQRLTLLYNILWMPMRITKNDIWGIEIINYHPIIIRDAYKSSIPSISNHLE